MNWGKFGRGGGGSGGGVLEGGREVRVGWDIDWIVRLVG